MELRQHRPLHPPQAGANHPTIDVISKKLDVRSCIVFVRTAALWNLLCYVLFLQAVLLEIFGWSSICVYHIAAGQPHPLSLLSPASSLFQVSIGWSINIRGLGVFGRHKNVQQRICLEGATREWEAEKESPDK